MKFKLVNQGEVIKYRLKGWAKYNRILEYNAPCQKDIGFFFMPVHIAAELIGNGKNTEMDALIDMWINTVYNDPQVKGSETAPVVYMRNGTGSPLIGYSELAERWGVLSMFRKTGKHSSTVLRCSWMRTAGESSS